MTDADLRAKARGSATFATDMHQRRRLVPFAVFMGVLFTQVAWIWATPPFRGIDEIDHAFRASSVAHGDLDPTRASASGDGILVEVSPGLAADARAQCLSLASKQPWDCMPQERLPNGDVLMVSTAAAYNPAFYAVTGVVAKGWDGATALYVMRAVVTLINALLLLVAAWCLTIRRRSAWPLAGLLAALTPMALYTSVLPAPNGLELCSATVLWCALLGLQGTGRRHHRRLWAAAAVAAVVLGSTRTSGPVFLVLITCFVSLVSPRRTWELVRSSWRTVLVVMALAGIATLYQVAWTLAHPPLAGLGERARLNMGLIMEQVVLWPFQWIGAFPYRDQAASPVTYVATGVLMAIIWGVGLRHGDSERWVALGVVGTCLVVPFFYTLATFAELGTFWQGRYALPLLVGAPILIGLGLDRPGQSLGIVGPLLPLLGLVSTCAALLHVVNLERRRPASVGDSQWHQPGAIFLVLLAVAAAVAYERALAWDGAVEPSRRRPDQ